MSETHPSYYRLDRCALGEPPDASLREHLARCGRCRAHLEAVAPRAQVPSWVLALERAPRRRTRARVTVFASLAAAALLGLALLRGVPEPSPYIGVKGAASAWVHVQRDGVARPWSGAPLVVGDRIRLEIATDDFTHVTVFSRAESGPVLLYRGAVTPHARVVLPKAWQVDGAPEDERLAVVLARVELSASAARAQLARRDPGQVQVIELVLPKGVP